MSKFGAALIYLLARPAPGRAREQEELPPIAAGAWATWAGRAPAPAPSSSVDDHSLTDLRCRLPDGTFGRLAVVEVAGDWTLVCRAA